MLAFDLLSRDKTHQSDKFCGSKTKKCLHFIVKMPQNKTGGQIIIWLFPSGSKFGVAKGFGEAKVRISETEYLRRKPKYD